VSNLLSEKDILLVAQHQDDQLETVLLQLIRGSGVQGLAAMPKIAEFGRGRLLRPFLEIPKTAIIDYAQQHALTWVEDPTNFSDEFDRNFLRHHILPALKNRWPSVAKTVSRSAHHCADAQQLLSEMGDNLLATVLNPSDHTLSIRHLRYLAAPKQTLVIRHWFSHHGLRMPSTALVRDIFQNLVYAKASANPQLKTAQATIRRYQDKIYCLTDEPATFSTTPLLWPKNTQQIQLPDRSSLQCIPSNSGIPLRLWQSSTITVRWRQGGETIRLVGREGHHRLKHWFQEEKIPPWQRERIPLVYFDQHLAAIADQALSAEVYCDGEACYQLKWHCPI
jgi:tRNA(Ile)-lysidine synthase